MITRPSRTTTGKRKQKRKAHHVATCGRAKVSVYKRTMPNGKAAFMVSNYSATKRRFDSYTIEADAIEAANRLARQLSQRDVVAANITKEQAIDFASARQTLEPLKLGLASAIATVTEAVKIVGDLPSVIAAAKHYAARHKRTTAKSVADVVAELLTVKEARGASKRYLEDLRSRLKRFANDFKKDCCNVTTSDCQAWFDAAKFPPQSYMNFRRVVHLLFKFAVARSYASDNPIEGVERVKVRGGTCEIFKPSELARLLASASADFLPCLAIGAFAGLRSAEIERLAWSDVDLAGRHITVGADAAKTGSRRLVPICDALAAWLQPYAERTGRVWQGTHEDFYQAQQDTATATAVEADSSKNIPAQKPVVWKANGLRHSFASYRFAELGDAGRVAGECGNSASVIHKHYRELVKPTDAQRWFAVAPQQPANVTSLVAATANR